MSQQILSSLQKLANNVSQITELSGRMALEVSELQVALATCRSLAQTMPPSDRAAFDQVVEFLIKQLDPAAEFLLNATVSESSSTPDMDSMSKLDDSLGLTGNPE